jgi:hypothetical protein
MRRRDFLRLAGTAGAAAVFPRLERTGQTMPLSDPTLDQGISQLPNGTFRARLAKAAELAAERGLSALFCEPSTNFAYLAGGNFGRSERLIALVIPTASMDPFFVAPQFEVERVERTVRPVGEVWGWKEEQDPFSLIAEAFAGLPPGRIGIEASARYGMATRLRGALPDWELADATSIFEGMRIIKSETEIGFIRHAVSITETSIAATFASLEAGVTDREVASYLSGQMRERGVSTARPYSSTQAAGYRGTRPTSPECTSSATSRDPSIGKCSTPSSAPRPLHSTPVGPVWSSSNSTESDAGSFAKRATASTSPTGWATAWGWTATNRPTSWRGTHACSSPGWSSPSSRASTSRAAGAFGSKMTSFCERTAWKR